MRGYLSILAVSASTCLYGAVTLFDFEVPAEAEVLFSGKGDVGETLITNICATSGGKALWMGPKDGCMPSSGYGFATIAWTDRSKDDWSRFNRLAFDVTNLSRDERHLVLYLYDRQMKKRKGARFSFRLTSGITRRIEIVLDWSRLDADPKSMRAIALVNSEPMFGSIALDRFVLLGKDDEEPLVAPRMAFPKASQEALSEESRHLDALDKVLADKEARRMDEMKRQLADHVPVQASNLTAFARSMGVSEAARIVVAQATGMDQIRPRQTDFSRLRPANGIRLRLAQGEYEGAQIAVASADGKPLKNVRVTADGEVAGQLDVSAAPVGYVFADVPTFHRQAYCEASRTSRCGYVRKTRETPLGWYADPILPFLKAVHVAPGDVQSFHVRVHAPEGCGAGTIEGRLRVSCYGVDDVIVPLSIRVDGFKIGKVSELPLLVSFTPYVQPLSLSWTKQQADEVRRDPEAPVNLWRRHRLEWADFLAEYFIIPSTIYPARGDSIPDFDLVKRVAAKGRFGCFTVGPWTKCMDESTWRRDYLEPLKRRVAAAREAGLGRWIVTYGCDETEEEYFPAIAKALDILHREIPGVPIVSTAVDPTLGTASSLGGIDWFVLLTTRWNPLMAAAARMQGRKVWWYVACGEVPPYANMFVESPLSEGRLLMGAQALRMRPDGFLYYSVAKWNQRRPITSGPFTDWSPHGIRHRNKKAYDGDGVWAYCGPDGSPIATLRLENFRDGVEDYNCAKVLERLLRAHGDKTDAWSVAAKEALEVPLSVMETMTNFTDNPAAIYEWRDRIADLIEAERKSGGRDPAFQRGK